MGEESLSAVASPILKAIESNLGHAQNTTLAPTVPPEIHTNFKFPTIPYGAETTIIPVAIPVLRHGKKEAAVQKLEVFAVFFLSIALWVLPFVLINRGICCRCFQRWLSRHLSCYCCLGFLFVISAVGIMIAKEPDVNANDLFFAFVAVLELLSDKLMFVLTQVGIILGILFAWVIRKKIVSLLGFDQQLVRGDLRDMLTLFQMERFQTIEVTVWKIEGLPPGFATRTLFVRVLLGFNEPQHSRPHDRCTNALTMREKFYLNYDPEDDTQKLSIVIKQQELVGSAVAQLAPVAGALVGAAGGVVTPLGPAAGAGLGVVTGVGAANSLGVEVARVDLSSAMVNRLRDVSDSVEVSTARSQIGTGVLYNAENFLKVDLVPQGQLWLRIADVRQEEA